MLTVDELKGDGKHLIEAIILSAVCGAAYGYVFKLSPVGTAKISTTYTMISSSCFVLAKVATPRAYHPKISAIHTTLSGIGMICTYRHFGIISKVGTIVMSIVNLFSFLKFSLPIFLAPNPKVAS